MNHIQGPPILQPGVPFSAQLPRLVGMAFTKRKNIRKKAVQLLYPQVMHSTTMNGAAMFALIAMLPPAPEHSLLESIYCMRTQ